MSTEQASVWRWQGGQRLNLIFTCLLPFLWNKCLVPVLIITLIVLASGKWNTFAIPTSAEIYICSTTALKSVIVQKVTFSSSPLLTQRDLGWKCSLAIFRVHSIQLSKMLPLLWCALLHQTTQKRREKGFKKKTLKTFTCLISFQFIWQQQRNFWHD